jgi:hypothetical protein
VNTVRLSGLRGTSMVVIDPSVVFAALDNFFGGFGRGIDGLPPRENIHAYRDAHYQYYVGGHFCFDS